MQSPTTEDVSRSRTRNPSPDRALDQFGLSCARVESVSLDERLDAARQVCDEIYKDAPVELPAGNAGSELENAWVELFYFR